MNKLLVVSLGSNKEVLQSSFVISRLRENYPHSEIHLLTLKSLTNRAKSIKNVAKVHTIDDQKISKIKQGAVYSNGYAIDVFFEGLAGVLSTDWDQVINQSHNTLSTLIVSAVNTETRNGVSLSKEGTTILSSDWAVALNSVNTFSKRKPIETNIINTHLVGSPWINTGDGLKVSEQYSLLSGQNFSRIRSMKPGDSKIIGISLSQGYDGTFIGSETLEDIVGTLKESTNYIPVLLIDPSDQNHKIVVNDLNTKFNNELISINVDFAAFSAITTHLDLIMSPATDYLLGADLQGTIALELRNTHSFKNDPVITTEGSRVLFYENDKNLSSELIFAINEIFETELPVDTTQGGANVYACIKDEYGYFFSQLKGEINLFDELDYHLSRSLFFQILGYPENQALLENIKEMCSKDEIQSYVGQTRADLTGAVKILLATLRSMKVMRNSSDGINSFLSYYDQLLAYGKQENIIGHLIRFTEGKIENIHDKDSQKNLELIEKALFELKANIQKVTEICGILIGDLPAKDKGSVIQK